MPILELTKAQIIYFGKYPEEIIRRQNTYAASNFIFTHIIQQFHQNIWCKKIWYCGAVSILENADQHIRENP